MAVRKKKAIALHHSSNLDQIKQEIITLLTGQDPDRKGDFDYWALIKRVTVLLIAVYGIARVRTLRQLAFSLVSTAVTAWLAETVTESVSAASFPSGRK